ncbi:hypothetical protein [Rickettsia bellii]|uniref:Uncharacterized protein n=1 Tax=Rickettsia bellii str. RML An4 TaxID=1359193 RepID=A0A0F3QCL1_RICBE|nr:hypothetical protein [Rickettsia bellii]KJV90325.1 hypothetical protein RBEAN4_1328 [Rickettsia bellii str. RML An4]
MQEFKINSASVAHMATQVRVKQLATRDSQYKVLASIVETWEKNQADKSGEANYKEIIKDLKEYSTLSKSINDYFHEQKIPADLGYPIKFNKTDLQLKMAYKYAKQQDDNLIAQIKNGHFYNNQYCYVDSTKLPVLQADNSDSY